MLGDADVQPMLPVDDLDAARAFYEGTLGLERVDEIPGEVVVYRSGNTRLCVYRSSYAGTNEGTAAVWNVPGVDALVAELAAKGVTFEHYDLEGLTQEGDVYVAGDLRVAWFKDPAGNILSVQNG